ncbi:ABC-2 type transport system ATP-binding protein [Microbacterium sp. ru370.1]|uniref:ABC transporter ATP-binding protein n=1 Tax=unclassified Microbacterium TaxID=2609290 RepID=UPI0008906D43|nr:MULTISPECIES: ABC transporter ATP-binding protein [unclassified Microbacterium]SDO52356.1 ABC-2 type transport system ATP-binding protein [Microbacterium sp. ru370.1]SIT83815.1 ABC-2 type transport system ATP-binding protein [Microbacterium sp. RU1D]
MSFDVNVPAVRPEVVVLTDVSKRFVVRRDTSIKERIVTLGRAGRRHRQNFWALSDVSLDIRAGNTIGLIGHNGSGKSTLLKVIGGIIQPTSGDVRQRGRVAALIELGAGFHPDLTGRENVYLNASVLGLSREETRASFDDILDFSGVGDFIDTQVKFYSSGMFVRLAFAIAVHTDPDILLVDEVLAVGDEQFQRKCLDKIKEFQRQGRTIIIVSHALDQIEELCDRVILMDKGRVAFDGLADAAVERFRELLEEGSGKVSNRPEQITRAAEIVSVDVRAADGRRSNDFQSGESFRVAIAVRGLRQLDEWALGFSIDTSSGVLALASNTSMLGASVPALRAGETVTIEVDVDGARFNPGSYWINANLHGISESTSHALMQGAEFTVHGRSDSLGSVPAEVRFR